MIALSCGIGFGPLLSTAVIAISGVEGLRLRAAAPLYVVAVMWSFILMGLCIAIPSHMGDEHDKKHDSPPRLTVEGPSDTLEARKHVWMSAASFCFERAVMVSALEAATSLILELEFDLRPMDIGLAIGTAFCFATPITLFLNNNHTPRTLCILSFFSITATVLLFKPTTAAIVGDKNSLWLVLLADMIIFPTGYVANGIAEGLAMKHAIPNTFYSQENLVILTTVLEDCGGRFIGPVVARGLVESQGRDGYALLQLGFSFLAWVGALKIASAVSTIGKTES